MHTMVTWYESKLGSAKRTAVIGETIMNTRVLVVTVLCLSLLLMACQPIHPMSSANPASLLTPHEQANVAVVQNLQHDRMHNNNICVAWGISNK